MKRTIAYISTVIISVFIGCAGMYALIYYYPNVIVDTVNKVEKEVSVTDKGIADGINNVSEAVVVVENYQNDKLAGVGSGFIYDKKGYIMTNHHVVENASSIKIQLSNGETIDATVVGSDEYADIAVIKIDPTKITKVAKIGSSKSTSVGDTVFTIGSPVSPEYAGTVTRGILSGKNRMVEVAVNSKYSYDWIMNVMQTDAAINPGNSGGPLCNVNGEVIGINSMKIVQSSIEGIGFAIPIEDALDYANKLVSGTKVNRSYLGIEMTNASTNAYTLLRQGINLSEKVTSGVVITDAYAGGPSESAGLQKGDVIIKIGDYDIKKVSELKYYLFKYEPGTKVNVVVIRGSETKTFNVELGTSEN